MADEASIVLRARRMSQHLILDHVLLPIVEFIQALKDAPDNLVVRLDDTLGDGQAGHTVAIAGKQCIIINAKDLPERQRFTACHELAHVVLGIPTEHDDGEGPFPGRSPNEILCDVFAAEVLLPAHLARPIVEESELEFAAVEALAQQFGASLSAAGSRFAALCDRPCAFVQIQNRLVRYASRSQSLRDRRGFISPRRAVPGRSMAGRLLRGEAVEGPIELNADEWLEDWRSGGSLLEDAKYSARWNLALSLLWFDDDDAARDGEYEEADEDGEALLQPLDGVLKWKRGRR